MELRAAEGSRTERLGGPGQASGTQTAAERRRTCAFDTLAVSSRASEAAPGSSRPGGAEACPGGACLTAGLWLRPRWARPGMGSGAAGTGTTVPTALTAPSSLSEVWPTRGTCRGASPRLPGEGRRPGRGTPLGWQRRARLLAPPTLSAQELPGWLGAGLGFAFPAPLLWEWRAGVARVGSGWQSRDCLPGTAQHPLWSWGKYHQPAPVARARFLFFSGKR